MRIQHNTFKPKFSIDGMTQVNADEFKKYLTEYTTKAVEAWGSSPKGSFKRVTERCEGLGYEREYFRCGQVPTDPIAAIDVLRTRKAVTYQYWISKVMPIVLG